jgi:hypothetical protein
MEDQNNSRKPIENNIPLHLQIITRETRRQHKGLGGNYENRHLPLLGELLATHRDRITCHFTNCEGWAEPHIQKMH